MTALLIRVARALDSEWLEALASEAAECPTGRSRAVWMLGGTRLLIVALLRRHGLTIAGFSAAAAAVLVLGLAGSGSNPAVARNRIELPMLLAVLALLPALTRRLVGPVRPEPAARAVRIVGYLTLFVLITAKAVEARDGLALGNYFQVSKIGPLQAALWLLISAYAALLLYATSRQAPLSPRALTLAVMAGAVAGSVYFLRYGLHLWAWHVGWLCLCFLAAPALIGFAGARLAGHAHTPTRHGAAAALITGLSAALALAVLAAGAVAISPASAPLHSLPCSPCTAPHAALHHWSILVATTPASMLLLAAPLMALCAGVFGAHLTLVQAPQRAKP